jgi:hypothetical protein
MSYEETNETPGPLRGRAPSRGEGVARRYVRLPGIQPACDRDGQAADNARPRRLVGLPCGLVFRPTAGVFHLLRRPGS